MTKKITEAEAGVWIGEMSIREGDVALVRIAAAYGFEVPQEYSDASSNDEVEMTASDAVAFLNSIAPEGYSFGWYEAQFYLLDDAEWQQLS